MYCTGRHINCFISVVVGLADDAMDVLRRMKAGVKAEQVRATKRQSKQEVTKLFNYATPAKRKKKVKASTEWKHKFSCLAYRGQIRIPTTDVEKDDLLQAGLGEKEISFHDMNASAEEFRDIICGEFPQLKKAGGFQLCKCKPNSRELEILSTFAHDCPGNLKQRVGNAKTYIRPLQKDMDLSVVFNLPDGVCLHVSVFFSIKAICLVSHNVTYVTYAGLIC